MRFKTAVGQVGLMGGQRYDRVDGILVDERASRFAKGRGRGNLYILVDVSGPAPDCDIVAQRLAEVVRDNYYAQRASVTAGMQQAIREANNLLFNENRDSMPAERCAAGLTCAVLRDEDLFVAQAGPAALYAAHEGQVTRFPSTSPWLDNTPLEDVDAAPMGGRREVHVDLFHTRMNEGDTILLVESGLASQLSPTIWHDLLTATPTDALLDEILAAGEGTDLAALVVVLGGDELGEIAAQPAAVSEASLPEPAPVPTQRTTQWIEELRVGERAGEVRRSLAVLWAGLATFLKRLVPSQSSLRQTPGRQTATVKTVEKESNKAKDRRAGKPRSSLVQKLLMGIAIAIPVLVAAVVLYTVIQRDRSQQVDMQELWVQAQANWVQAQASGDPATARALLVEAEEALDRLLESQPERTDALDLQKRIQAQLDESNQVRQVHWEGSLMSYPQNSQLSRVVVEGVHVFVMDRNNNRVYHHQLDEFQQALQPAATDGVLVRKGDQVGGVLVGDLVDMVWMPVGSGRQKAGLVILESNGALIEYDPATEELSPLRVAGSDAWQFPELMGSHSGRFYLLDSTANEIWRYNPTPDGYSDPPAEWLQSEVDLAGVEDMAVGDSIYLLYADGGIRKLTAGQPDRFDISDWDFPPESPAAIFTRPPNDTQSVYTADRGNSRIVQSGKDGLFQRQFRLSDSLASGESDPLGDVTSLFVDEIGGRAYFLSGNQLYVIVLPE